MYWQLNLGCCCASRERNPLIEQAVIVVVAVWIIGPLVMHRADKNSSGLAKIRASDGKDFNSRVLIYQNSVRRNCIGRSGRRIGVDDRKRIADERFGYRVVRILLNK